MTDIWASDYATFQDAINAAQATKQTLRFSGYVPIPSPLQITSGLKLMGNGSLGTSGAPSVLNPDPSIDCFNISSPEAVTLEDFSIYYNTPAALNTKGIARFTSSGLACRDRYENISIDNAYDGLTIDNVANAVIDGCKFGMCSNHGIVATQSRPLLSNVICTGFARSVNSLSEAKSSILYPGAI